VKPALFGMIFYAGLSFGTYDTLRDKVLSLERDELFSISIKRPCAEKDGKMVTEWYVNSLCGMTAGLTAQFISFPMDSAKRRMQNAQLIHTQKALKDRLSMLATWKDLYARGGVRLIYKGFSLNIIRVIPATATSYTLNEAIHELFGVSRSK